MNLGKLIAGALAASILLPAAAVTRAGDENSAKDLQNERRELREKLKNMTPEERQAALKKWREEHPPVSRQEQLRKATEERNKLTPEQREARRKEARAVLEKRLADLKKKQADGTLTEQDKRRLERLEQTLKRTDLPPGEKPSADKEAGEKPAPKK